MDATRSVGPRRRRCCWVSSWGQPTQNFQHAALGGKERHLRKGSRNKNILLVDSPQRPLADRTQDPQYSKTAVLKKRSLKNRSTQNPQYSKTAVLKI